MILRFADFEFEPESGRLLKEGSLVPIQEKPLRVLSILLRHPNQLVTRQEIFEQIWAGTYVAEDESLNTAIRKVRFALNDSSSSPRFVETVGSRGYRFVHPVEMIGTQASTQRTLTIAVLPLENLGIEEDEHLREGITEELITSLGQLHPRFTVIALSSVLRYKEHTVDVSAILRELGADYILSGSIRRSGSRVRITVRLISGFDQCCLWSETLERKVGDIFSIQHEVAGKVARSTSRLLTQSSKREPNSAAHEIYLRGRHFWNKRTAQGLLKSIELYNQALAEDPEYALCYIGIADAYLMLVQHGVLSGVHALPIAKEAALKAFSLDPDSAEVHTSLAWVKATVDRDMAGAEKECRRALQMNPSYSFAYIAFSFVLTAMERHDESLECLRRGLQIDPVSLPMNAIYATALYFARNYEAAIEQCQECIDLDPGFSLSYSIYGQSLEAMGAFDKAEKKYQRNLELAPWSPFPTSHLARIYTLRNMTSEATEYLGRLFADSGNKHVPPYYVAHVYIAMRNYDAAFEWLARAEQDRSLWIMFLAVDPKADPLRNDPRLKTLLHKLGLQQSIQ